MRTRHQCAVMALLLGGFLLSSTAVRAQSWSSVASVCQPGVDSAGLYTFNGAIFEFAGTSVGQIKTRCSVTNPLDTGVPTWSKLVVGYEDPDGTGTDYQVDAQLVRTDRSTGISFVIKVFDSSSFTSTGPTVHSVSFTHTFDFTNFAYYVSLTVTRGDSVQNPQVWVVQLR